MGLNRLLCHMIIFYYFQRILTRMAASALWSLITSTSFLTLLLLITIAALSYYYVVKVKVSPLRVCLFDKKFKF